MKRRGMALGLAALMTCTALFTTTAKAENKGSDEKETIKFTYWGSGDEKKAIEESVDKFIYISGSKPKYRSEPDAYSI